MQASFRFGSAIRSAWRSRRWACSGAGLMGAGIAQISAAAGFKTIVLEVNDGVLEKGLGRIEKFLTTASRRARWPPRIASKTLGQPARARRATRT